MASSLRAQGLGVEVVPVSTEGDRRLDVPLHQIGGKGVFVKEIQKAVLDGRADIAVHSAKDLPAVTPEGLVLAAVPVRADPRDVLVGSTLDALAPGATVATGSTRRRVQLQALRPDLSFCELRGNIATRLGVLADDDGVDAVLMARAALDRLGLDPDDHGGFDDLEAEVMVPQVGQGTLAVECRADDDSTRRALVALNDPDVERVFLAERAFLAFLGGDCDLPAGAFGQLVDGAVSMVAMLAADGSVPRRATGRDVEGEALGRRLAGELSGTAS